MTLPDGRTVCAAQVGLIAEAAEAPAPTTPAPALEVEAAAPAPQAPSTPDIAPRASTPAGPIIWILSKGEIGGGGYILGVYASKDVAKGPFTEAARSIPFDIDAAWQDEDGAVHVSGRCDWVSLEPHPLITKTQIA